MASLPSQPPAPQRQTTSHQRSPSPTASSARRPSRSSQSLTSEDSQTLLIGTPTSSSSPKTHSPGTRSPKPTDHTTSAEASGPEPRKCWICFADETEDTPSTSEWVSPCPCALTAHQACLLDWVADLKAPNRKNAKKVQCPQCKADIKVAQPRSVAVALAQAFERIRGRLLIPAAFASAMTAVVGGCYIHGVASVQILMGDVDAARLLGMNSVRGRPSLRVMASIPFIPVALILSRTTVADGILPVLPMFFLLGRQRPTKTGPLWPPSIMMTLCALPYLRSIYNGFQKQVMAPREKAWLKEIQPRAAENAEENPNQAGQQDPEAEAQNGNEDGIMDFELGVEVEVIEEEVLPDQPQPPQAQPDHPQPQNDNQAQPPQPAPQHDHPPAHFQQNILINIGLMTNTIVGALLFPTISYFMGSALHGVLPSRLTTPPPRRWVNVPGRPTGLLQTQWGRSLVGGLLFVVLKDALGFWARWSMKEGFKHRKVLDYGREGVERERLPWWRRIWGELRR